MNQLTKARITVGLLAYFATVWVLIRNTLTTGDVIDGIISIIVLLGVLLIISIALLGILEWIKIFDLKTNSILALIILISISFSTSI